MSRIKVLIVDDSAVVRQVIGNALQADARIDLIGAVANPLIAIEHMNRQWPDVVLLDIEMPKMDGLTFLRMIMKERPTPVIICSTLTEAGARTTIDALAAGAARFPRARSAVRAAARANVRALAARPTAPQQKFNADAVLLPGSATPSGSTERVVAFGTSTGGTQALEAVLTCLPAYAPAIVAVQHMPEKFTSAFAERLDSVCRIRVVEASHGMALAPGLALIAPGGKHLVVRRQGNH